MKAKYEYKNNDGEWEKDEIDSDDLENHSDEPWTEESLMWYLGDVLGKKNIKNFEII